MIDAGKAVPKTSIAAPPFVAPARALAGGAVFGFAFGFLLQKGGVGTYHILIGQLLLQDWTVVKIMATAIGVGMIGIFVLNRFAKVDMHLQPTKLGSNILGGLLFGAGFGLIGYCPGTAAAALGQGSWDALFGMAGLVAGSWIYAELSGRLKASVENWGNLGKLTLWELLHIPRGPAVGIVALVISAALILLDRYAAR